MPTFCIAIFSEILLVFAAIKFRGIDLFMRCRRIDFAAIIFDRMGERDVISWNTMFSGYSNNGGVDLHPYLSRETWRRLEKMPYKDSASYMESDASWDGDFHRVGLQLACSVFLGVGIN
ncbi:hypothetical protein SAY87_028247 [Trapa incisa]|uniref:Pentatricopeptide repeat-containing protein n=1 Tax=Trapa incisa TaxID=236973 RepID=A0AAN7KZG3_9MYRT|nr:hypothetical protein SAY87_028247 [Trapa incisa]